MNTTATTFDFGSGPVPAHRHPNGGGWVADTATVADTAYVGPNALVSGNARVSGNAWVTDDARVSKTPKVLTGFPHIVTITDHHVRAGCEQHPPSVWAERGTAIIKADGFSSDDAKSWAAIINAIAAAHGCTDQK